MKNNIIALFLKFIGIKPKYSTDIVGNLTCGYGEIDWNGYFQYPLWGKSIPKQKFI